MAQMEKLKGDKEWYDEKAKAFLEQARNKAEEADKLAEEVREADAGGCRLGQWDPAWANGIIQKSYKDHGNHSKIIENHIEIIENHINSSAATDPWDLSSQKPFRAL